MKMIATNNRAASAYIAVCSVLIYAVTAAEQHLTRSETGRSSNHDAFVTIDNILMDEDDLSTNSNTVFLVRNISDDILIHS